MTRWRRSSIDFRAAVIVDSSIIVALILNEPTTAWIADTLKRHSAEPRRMSWVNVAESALGANRFKPGAGAALEPILRDLETDLLVPDFEVVRLVAFARVEYRINFGDCFAYAHAQILRESLLTLDADFLTTDLPRVLHPAA